MQCCKFGCSVTEAELKRLKEAFKRSSSLSGYMPRNAFFREVLGDNVPLRLAEVTCHAQLFDNIENGCCFKNVCVCVTSSMSN